MRSLRPSCRDITTQARIENLALVAHDHEIAKYGVAMLDARS